MTEPMSREEVLAGIRQEIAEQVAAAEHEADPIKRDRMLRHARSREDLAEDEVEAIAADIAENEQAALSLRVPASLSHCAQGPRCRRADPDICLGAAHPHSGCAAASRARAHRRTG
jgi:hypothetical protein